MQWFLQAEWSEWSHVFANVLVDTLCWQSKYELPRLTSHLQHSLVFWEHDLWDGKWNKFVEQGVGSHPFRRWSNHQKFWIFMDILLITVGCLDTCIQISKIQYKLYHVYGIVQLNQLRLDSTSHFPSLVIAWLHSILSEMPSVHATTFWGDEMLRTYLDYLGGLVVGSQSITFLTTLTTYGI